MDQTIEAHNKKPAAVWGSAGDAYDKISRQIGSALDHCVSRIEPKPGEHILGWRPAQAGLPGFWRGPEPT
jgi:hypothetical protein